MYQFTERIYLTADGKPTRDPGEANELLGHPGDEITAARARELGLKRSDDPATTYELTERVFLDAAGQVVPEGHEAAVSMLGAPGHTIPLEQAQALGLVEAAQPAKPTKKDLLARAAELGIEGLSERTKNDDIEAAIKVAEDALAKAGEQT